MHCREWSFSSKEKRINPETQANWQKGSDPLLIIKVKSDQNYQNGNRKRKIEVGMREKRERLKLY